MLFGAILGVLVGVVIGMFVIEPVREGAIASAERRYERQLERCLDGRLVPLRQTEYATYEEFCAEVVHPEQMLQGMKLVDLRSLLDGTAMLVILLGALLGSSLGGADHATGTITTLLTWEPRRARVLAARAIAIAGTVFLIAVISQAWLGLVFTGAVALKGTFALTPDGFAADVAAAIVRIAGVATCFALIGLAFATVGRSTVAAMGAFLGYLIVLEGFLAASVWGIARIALGRAANVAATGVPMQLPNPRPPRGATQEQLTFTLMPGRAWLTLAAWTLVLGVIAVAAFRLRDVT
jgi:hypothetical protein